MSIELNKESVEQAGGDERVIGWRERILAAHPNSDPGFWPDALLVEHMAAEIADLRAALAQPSQSQYEASFEEWLANELEGEDGQPVPAAVCDIALALRAFNHWPKLEHPAKVGGVRFSAGVSSRLVVEAAQRLYEFESTPEKEAERIERLQAFREQLDPLNLAPHAEAFNEAPAEALKPGQAEAERPEVVAYADPIAFATFKRRGHEGGVVGREWMWAEPSAGLVAMSRSDECECIIGELRSERDAANARLHEVATACATAEQERDGLWRDLRDARAHIDTQAAVTAQLKGERDAALAEVERIKAISDNYYVLCVERQQQLDTALARVAELEKQDLVDAPGPDEIHQMAFEEGQPAEDGDGYLFSAEEFDLFVQRLLDSCATTVAQAQQLNDLDKQCRDDVARALGLRPNQERGFAWSYLLASIKSCVKASGDSAQAQHSGPEGWMLVPVEPLLNMMSDKDHDTRITAERQLLSILAAAPGKEVPQAWIDVQEERRRQITAEGWTPEHDDLYCAAELPRAAAAYILNGANDEAPAIWPFSAKWWKPRDARANYMRAGALILAEIERLDRAAAAGKEVGHE